MTRATLIAALALMATTSARGFSIVGVTGNGQIARSDDSGGNWFLVPNDVSDGFSDIDCLNTRQCWAVDDAGAIHFSADGGATWNEQRSGTGRPALHSIYFTDEEYGWAVGDQKLILATTDGGETWKEQHSGNFPNTDYTDVHFVGRTHGWVVSEAVGNTAEVRHTTDGGESWSFQTASIGGPHTAVWFTDRNNGWIASDRSGDSYFGRTTNGGAEWEKVKSPAEGKFADVQFANKTTGWVLGGKSLFRTTDGGQNWIAQEPPGLGSLEALDVLDARRAVIAGSGNIGNLWITTDGGDTWTQRLTGITGGYVSVAIFVPEPSTSILAVLATACALAFMRLPRGL